MTLEEADSRHNVEQGTSWGRDVSGGRGGKGSGDVRWDRGRGQGLGVGRGWERGMGVEVLIWGEGTGEGMGKGLRFGGDWDGSGGWDKGRYRGRTR